LRESAAQLRARRSLLEVDVAAEPGVELRFQILQRDLALRELVLGGGERRLLSLE
jgi:hypothetical protein